ncbi:MAG: sugar phosphate nucleotidyltransferase [Patescibacteria group bacterium]|jgi:mannose-1-phosphate guanylyltransferase
MKAIIFAGGSGIRLWPLSRRKSPKQFEKIIGNKSTLQLAVDRLLPDFKYSDIYISTNFLYADIVRKQLPDIPESNFLFEPEKKDVAPAIALAMGILSKLDPEEPVAILWSDHLVKQVSLFKKILKIAGAEIKKDPNKIIFIANKPRFPSTNLGYIHVGEQIKKEEEINLYKFEGLKYKPNVETAEKFLKSEKYGWNLGYFVTSSNFIYKYFQRLAPNIYNNTESILKNFGKENYQSILKQKYGQVESINFDNAILENLDKNDAFVIFEDIGWSDVGSWEALKEALQLKTEENVINGKVYLDNVSDSLIYNYDEKKIIVAVDLEELIIINTPDAMLITKKNSMGKVKKIVESFPGTEHENLT